MDIGCTWAAAAQSPTSSATRHEQEHLGRCWPVETPHPLLIHPQVIWAVVEWEAQQDPGVQGLGLAQGQGFSVVQAGSTRVWGDAPHPVPGGDASVTCPWSSSSAAASALSRG